MIGRGKDPLFGPAYIGAYRCLLPDSKIVVSPGGSHPLHQERYEEIAKLIIEFAGSSGTE